MYYVYINNHQYILTDRYKDDNILIEDLIEYKQSI